MYVHVSLYFHLKHTSTLALDTMITRSRKNNKKITLKNMRIMMPDLDANLTAFGQNAKVNVSSVRKQLRTPCFPLVCCLYHFLCV